MQNERQPRNTATIRPETLRDMEHGRAMREAAVAVGVFGPPVLLSPRYGSGMLNQYCEYFFLCSFLKPFWQALMFWWKLLLEILRVRLMEEWGLFPCSSLYIWSYFWPHLTRCWWNRRNFDIAIFSQYFTFKWIRLSNFYEYYIITFT